MAAIHFSLNLSAHPSFLFPLINLQEMLRDHHSMI